MCSESECDDVQKFFIALGVVVFVLGIVMNFLIILVMTKDKKLRLNSTNLFIRAIATTDLLISLWLLLLILVNYWSLVAFAKTATIILLNITGLPIFLISVNLQVGISIDRFWAVCHPFTYFLHKKSNSIRYNVNLCVAFGVLIGLGLGYIKVNKVSSLSSVLLCCWTLTSSIVVAVLNGIVYRAISKHGKKRLELFASTSEEQRKLYQHEIKMAKIMTLVVSTFLICWFPLTIICICELLNIKHVQQLLQSLFSSYDYAAFFILLATPAFNSLIDPLIYALRMAEVRKALWRCLKGDEQPELSREGTRTTNTANTSQTQPRRRSNLNETPCISTLTIKSHCAAV